MSKKLIECTQCGNERPKSDFEPGLDVCTPCMEHNHQQALHACASVRTKNARAEDMKTETATQEAARNGDRVVKPRTPRPYPFTGCP